MLISFGATSIILDAPNGTINSIRFIYPFESRPIPFAFKVDTEKTTDLLWKEYCKNTTRRKKTRDDFLVEADNIAWRIFKDLIHAQLSVLSISAAGFIDVFAGYLVTNMNTCETLGDRLRSGTMDKLLTEGLFIFPVRKIQ
jgi:hypothetical protein